MKAKLLLLTATLFIVSCNQKPKEQVETHYSNVQTEAEIRAKSVKDSLEKVKIDSLALIAWGDVKFGINMKQTLATETFKKGERYNNRIDMNLNQEIKFQSSLGLSYLHRISAHFEGNELSEIQIESNKMQSSEIERLITDCKIFNREFTKKYGNPSFLKDKISGQDFGPRQEFTYAKFEIGNKNITIKLGEYYSGNNYYYIIYINNNQFPKKKHVQSDQEKKQQKKYVEELKEIKSNSF